MSYNATENSASRRIATLLDEEALLKLAELLQLEAQLSTCRRRQLLLTVLSLDME